MDGALRRLRSCLEDAHDFPEWTTECRITAIDRWSCADFKTTHARLEEVVRRPSYNPKPIDVSEVKLSDEILDLRELLAKNAHEVWALQRIRDGWQYGPTRNDARKEHPSLVPYEDLSESEKNYDRNTVMETLKIIAALGYRIERA